VVLARVHTTVRGRVDVFCSRTASRLVLLFHAAVVIPALEVVGEIGHLRSRHESRPAPQRVACEVLMKTVQGEVSQPVLPSSLLHQTY